MYNALNYFILPELVTEFVMQSKRLSYKKASLMLYNNRLPSSHHIDILRHQNVLYSTEVSGILMQCIHGNIAEEWTHGLLNPTDRNLRHSNNIAKAIRYTGGIEIDNTCIQHTAFIHTVSFSLVKFTVCSREI